MKKGPVVCIGASLIDESYICHEQPLQGTSNIATHYRSPGGVARNIANHLSLLGNNVELITHFGTDPDGLWLMEQCRTAGTGLSHSLLNDAETGRFVALLSPEGDLFTGAVSCRFENMITLEFIQQKAGLIRSASLLLLDTNLSKECLDWLLQFCREEKIPCIIEPVSVPKAGRLLYADLSGVMLVTPNKDEMLAITGSARKTEPVILVNQVLERGVQYVWKRDGKDGSGIYSRDFHSGFPAPEVDVADTTGAGDAALAGWIHAWLDNRCLEDCIVYGHAMASIILQVKGAVHPGLTVNLLETSYKKLMKQYEPI
ncbi:MAG: PfkB family carbohydrate kinase [Bacteroidota bacterium]